MKSLKKLGRPRILIVGCGDVGMRCLPILRQRFRVFALTSQASRRAPLREAGAVPLLGDLDHPDSLRRLRHVAPRVLHLAPPPPTGALDSRTRHLLNALCFAKPGIVPERFAGAARRTLVYASTSGVYGDCGGAWVDETRPVRPTSARAVRRVDAEQAVRRLGVRRARAASGRAARTRAAWRSAAAPGRGAQGWRNTIVRIPGIYAADRLPLARLAKATPALRAEDDVYTNHIHADDLAAILVRALWRGKPQRVIHASDDTRLKMADYFDRVADAAGLARAPRLTRAQARQQMPPALWSFMCESRRLDNRRLKQELGYALRYPTVDTLLAELYGDRSPVPARNTTA